MDPVTLGAAKADAARKYGVQPNTIGVLGDSFAANNNATSGTAGAAGSTVFYDAFGGFLPWVTAKLHGRIKQTINTGVAGTRTDQWLAGSPSQVSQVVAARPSWCVITPPTNDREQGVALATAQGYYLQVINTLRAAGIRVILLGLCPESSGTVGTAMTQAKLEFTVAWNYWIKTLAVQKSGVLAVDPFGAFGSNSTDGGWIDATANRWTTDNLHPKNWAQARIGKLIADALDPLVPYVDPRPLASIDSRNMVISTPNVLFGGGNHGTAGSNGSTKGGSGTVVSNFNVGSSDGANFAGTVVSSIVAATDQRSAPWQQHALTVAASKLRVSQSTISTGYTAGSSIIRPQVEIDMDSDISSVSKLNLALQLNIPGGTIEYLWSWIHPSTGDFPTENRLTVDSRGRFPVLVGPEATMPANATSVGWYLDFTGLGTIRWRYAALRVGPTL